MSFSHKPPHSALEHGCYHVPQGRLAPPGPPCDHVVAHYAPVPLCAYPGMYPYPPVRFRYILYETVVWFRGWENFAALSLVHHGGFLLMGLVMRGVEVQCPAQPSPGPCPGVCPGAYPMRGQAHSTDGMPTHRHPYMLSLDLLCSPLLLAPAHPASLRRCL